ncbi:hypothetical protein AB0918_09840 [Streptomyces sp. NPDC006864]|uniref:hypothetical protein n=1 Tax=Streptomyces sp. NPDC006864 TaxID=3154780 RepID=UPI003456F349
MTRAPSEDHAAALLDDQGTVWSEVPTGGDSDDLVLPLVYVREEAVSRRDLADRCVMALSGFLHPVL